MSAGMLERPAAGSTMRRLAHIACLLAIAAVLAACGHARVVDRERGGSSGRVARGVSTADTYVVARGDTLYGIAFRHGLDYRDVAALNRIGAPYTIYPGQRLRLRASGGAARPAPPPTVATTPRTTTPVRPRTPVTPRPGTSPAVPTTTPMIPPPLPSTPAPSNAAVTPTGWRWPTQGTVIGRFAAGDPKRQGVDIAGTAGQAVVAAADGTVVYSGAGLVGYGELIIIKHSDEWLSAYAHNRRRLVAEGTAVKGGQPIAELGRTGTSRDMLHFEVRRNGKPVDPLGVLPRN